MIDGQIASAAITAGVALSVGVLGWLINRKRTRHDLQASFIDDLHAQMEADRQAMAAATAELRQVLNYVMILRRQLSENDIEPSPWPDELHSR